MKNNKLTIVDMLRRVAIRCDELEAAQNTPDTIGGFCPDHPDIEFVVYCPVDGCQQPFSTQNTPADDCPVCFGLGSWKVGNIVKKCKYCEGTGKRHS